MPTFEAQVKADELQRQLATLTGHELVKVRPYGKHLLIQMHRGDAVDVIAPYRIRSLLISISHPYLRWSPCPVAPICA